MAVKYICSQYSPYENHKLRDKILLEEYLSGEQYLIPIIEAIDNHTNVVWRSLYNKVQFEMYMIYPAYGLVMLFPTLYDYQ